MAFSLMHRYEGMFVYNDLPSSIDISQPMTSLFGSSNQVLAAVCVVGYLGALEEPGQTPEQAWSAEFTRRPFECWAFQPETCAQLHAAHQEMIGHNPGLLLAGFTELSRIGLVGVRSDVMDHYMVADAFRDREWPRRS